MKKTIKAPKWYLEEREQMDKVLENFSQTYLGVGREWLETQIKSNNMKAIATLMHKRDMKPEDAVKMDVVFKYLKAYSTFTWERLRMEHLGDDLINAANITYDEEKQEFSYDDEMNIFSDVKEKIKKFMHG